MAIIDALGDRMKENYENRAKHLLTRRTPVIIRLDGCHFHTFTKGFSKPFDALFSEAMQETAKYLCEHIQGCKVAYTQSDEITLLLVDYDTLETSAWFDYKLEKVISVSASLATLAFNKTFAKLFTEKIQSTSNPDPYYVYYTAMQEGAYFDARAFNMPKEEVNNCFVWRQLDAKRNSINSLAQSLFSHKELQGLNLEKTKEKCLVEKGISWNALPTTQKIGSCVVKTEIPNLTTGETRSAWVIDNNIPNFIEDPNYIEKYI